jgi:hypothetical protein
MEVVYILSSDSDEEDSGNATADEQIQFANVEGLTGMRRERLGSKQVCRLLPNEMLPRRSGECECACIAISKLLFHCGESLRCAP